MQDGNSGCIDSHPKTPNLVNEQIGRRSFFIAGAAAIGTTALSYGRIMGANDRISIGHIGVGNRGRELASIVANLKDSHKVEMTAVCDLWRVNRERAVEKATAEADP